MGLGSDGLKRFLSVQRVNGLSWSLAGSHREAKVTFGSGYRCAVALWSITVLGA